MAVAVPFTDRIAILIEMTIVLVRMQTARSNLAPSHNARSTHARAHIQHLLRRVPNSLLINSNLIAFV